MTNNIFVPQTFNGERMVNVNIVNRKSGTSPSTSTASESKKQVIPTEPVKNENENSNKSNKGKAIAPAPVINTNYTVTNTATNSNANATLSTPTPKPDERKLSNSQHKYWPEANIALLIQLHRKYYTKGDINWTQLVQEYNSITGEDRGMDAITHKWSLLLKKYNAERCCMSQQQSTSNGKTTIPTVSYWNHFQYMNSYLSHTPILEDSLHSEHILDTDLENVVIPTRRIEDQQQRKKVHSVSTEHNESLNYIVMEQALKNQQSQIDLLQKNYETMSQMNLKFFEICEKMTMKSQSNESRYLDLLEKYMMDKLSEKNTPIPRKRKAESNNDNLEE